VSDHQTAEGTGYDLAINPAAAGFGSHEPSAVLFRDGTLVFGIEEARLVGRKHAPGTFPTRAIRACLDHAELSFQDIDRVLIPWRRGPGHAEIERRLRRIDRPVPPIEWFPHHRSHAASAFFPSGFEEALVLTVDARGSRHSTAVWHGVGDDLHQLAAYPAPNSLGYLYGAVTGYLGYRVFGGEGTVMALSAYGDPNVEIRSRLRSTIGTGAEYNVTGLVGGGVPSGIARLEGLFDRPRTEPADPSDPFARDLAFETQRLLEEVVVGICRKYLGHLGTENVCLAGGVATNSAMNGRVAADAGVSGLFVPSVPHDAGAPIGAGMLASGRRRSRPPVYCGPASPQGEIERLLRRRGVDFDEPEDLAGAVAFRLADGAVVGWFQGRLEMGPRALGNRSILADPREERVRDRINAFVKHRAPWRPFAPSILDSAASSYLEGTADRYMTRTVAVRPKRRGSIPGVVHPADRTTRPQIVTEKQNPRFHRLLGAFGSLTGVPVLLNTSFNDHGRPIVATPTDALSAAGSMALDLLVLGDAVIDLG
jgi:carbamoyltransferase